MKNINERLKIVAKNLEKLSEKGDENKASKFYNLGINKAKEAGDILMQAANEFRKLKLNEKARICMDMAEDLYNVYRSII